MQIRLPCITISWWLICTFTSHERLHSTLLNTTRIWLSMRNFDLIIFLDWPTKYVQGCMSLSSLELAAIPSSYSISMLKQCSHAKKKRYVSCLSNMQPNLETFPVAVAPTFYLFFSFCSEGKPFLIVFGDAGRLERSLLISLKIRDFFWFTEIIFYLTLPVVSPFLWRE